MYPHPIIEQLNEIVSKHTLTEKIFVVPSHRDGQLAIQALARAGQPVLNVKVKTFMDLALELVKPIMKKANYEQMPYQIGKQYIFSELQKLKTGKQLHYFNSVQLTPAFSQAVYQAILDLKQARVTVQTFPKQAFLKPEKGEDLYRLFQAYEHKRQENRLLDAADIFELALKQLIEQKHSALYIFFPHEAFYRIEKDFFLHYTKGANVIALGFPSVVGVEPLPEMIPPTKNHQSQHPFSFLYQIEEAPREPDLTLKAAISEDEEIQSVFRQLKNEKLPFDQSVIFYTSGRPYVESVLRFVQKQKLEDCVTFAEGVPVNLTKPGKLIKGVFQWIRENYNVNALAKLIREGCISLNQIDLSGEKVIELLHDADIHWGRERYLHKLNEKMADLALKVKEDPSNQRAVLRLERYKQLEKWLTPFMARFEGNKMWDFISYKKWLCTLKDLLLVEDNSTNGLDTSAKNQLIEAIMEVEKLAAGEMTLGEALNDTEQWLMKLTVGASMPKPGHLHVSPHRIGLYLDRPHVFVVGLDNGRFPGRQKEDPILLDLERKLIHPEMTLGREFVKRNFYLFVQLLLTTKGHVQMSYPFMDTVENRRSAPSHLFLQAYRLKTRQPSVTGEELAHALQEDVHFIQKEENNVLHESEWWAKQLWNSNQLASDVLGEEEFLHLKQAEVARYARRNEIFTEFDGRIEYEHDKLDPRKNENLTITTSKLEMLGTCPYKYFLKHILYVEEEQVEEFDMYSWLNPPTRGSLLHEVFERFYDRLKEEKQKPQVEKHLDLIIEIADQVLSYARESNPPPSEIIYLLERQEILESCSVFLKAEEEASDDGDPLFFEFSFGISGQDPATIDLANGETIRLSGKIDRVDRLKNGLYAIIDYKTGSSYGYTDKAYFNGGRKLQHSLYALAFEKLFAHQNAQVSSSAYLFPTLKGQGERIERKHNAEEREKFLSIVEHLCELLAQGHFPYTDVADDCKYCDYKIICQRHTYEEEILAKKHKEETASGALRLKEVRSYD
ncbi:PD-(D/E)XK nuclease family protein [Alkalihalobacterium elongatum]|uniref:PD-(D/E)XK nuclease family protein n=1 Tax=Alkalihalobacterium elongatum TaxID=2675466 RepID=UPI001C1F649A|nr:PD-(D/E)XK nuclease family protein [Alkalihalobacterium elongatum]